MAAAAAGIVAAPAAVDDDGQRRPNFVEHVAPIAHLKCAPCHRPGGPAPFSLLSYDDLRARSEDVLNVIQSRHMPPWRAAAARGYPPLRDDARLTDRQVSTIVNWVRAGMPSGNLARATPPATFPTGWPLGVPDLTLSLPRTLSIPAGTDHRIFNVALDLNLPQDRWITAVDYQPSSRAAVHHALFFTAPASLVVDDLDALPGFAGLFGTGPVADLTQRMRASAIGLQSLGAWVPGGRVRIAPDGLAPRLPARSNLIMQVHARPSDTGAIEDGHVAIYFSKAPLNRTVVPLPLPPALGLVSGLDIPPGEPRYVLRDAFTLPADVDAVGAHGYAHLRAKEMKLTARLPNGSTRGLLWIDRWDVDWQETYYFAAPVRLPKGTVIQSEITFDNSAGNPRNPSSPPRRVAWGPTLADEVGTLVLLVAAKDDAGTAALEAARERHFDELLMRPIRR